MPIQQQRSWKECYRPERNGGVQVPILTCGTVVYFMLCLMRWCWHVIAMSAHVQRKRKKYGPGQQLDHASDSTPA